MGLVLQNNCPSVAESLTSPGLGGMSPAVPGELQRLIHWPEKDLITGRLLEGRALQGDSPWVPRVREEVKLNEELNNQKAG